MPVVDVQEHDAMTYRTNQLVQIWLVEEREYRSLNNMPDRPEKSIWGNKQKEWLKRMLLESNATFKILLSATLLVGPDGTTKRDNHVNPRGFRHEGREFFYWLVRKGFSPKGFFVISGDRHWQYHATYPSGFEGCSCVALGITNAIQGFCPGDPQSYDPLGK